MFGTLGWPLILGLAACSVFYGLIFQGPLNTPVMHRYFATHPVAFAASAMFAVGLAALILKLINVISQYRWMHQLRLLDESAKVLDIPASSALLDGLDELPAGAQQTFLVQRMRQALEHVERTGSAEGLNEELKYLSDVDATKQHDSHALVRIISWATPMLGFLGTVIGITQALGDLNPAEMAASIDTAMDGLLAGLYVAFDTTTLALSLSILLMFGQFLVDRLETVVLFSVDERVTATLVGRFEQLGTSQDPHVASVERMSREVLEGTERLVQRQAELWQASMESAHEQWNRLIESTQAQTEGALGTALEHSLRTHAEVLAEASQNSTRQLQEGIAMAGEQLQGHQAEMIRQTETLSQVVRATGEIVQLEQALNGNLEALAGSQHFEQTVLSLSAAIQLLNARLGQTSGDRQAVAIQTPSERAA